MPFFVTTEQKKKFCVCSVHSAVQRFGISMFFNIFKSSYYAY